MILRLLLAVSVASCKQCGGGETTEAANETTSPAPRARPAPEDLARRLQDVLIVGGGADPSSTQVSLAQDARLAREAMTELGSAATVLFAGGDASLVQVAVDPMALDLRGRLAELFDPRDRNVRYEAVNLSVDGPADTEMLLALLEEVGPREQPLLLIVLGHGERGEAPQDSVVRLWGDIPLTVQDLAATLGDTPTRLVMTTCFGGGFANVAYQDGDPEADDALAADRCGFFATTWDREASGCDPNPERGQQLGYAMHFFNALQGQTRTGEASDMDLDDDGSVSLLEAHTHARVAARSFDVPTTTAEYYLRRVAERSDAPPFVETEEAAVIAQVGAELGLADEASTLARFSALETQLTNVDFTVASAQEESDLAYYALRIRLLERWPTLDDPWRGDFDSLLENEGAAIIDALDESSEGRDYAATLTVLEQAATAYDEVQAELARVMTLARAYETAALAGTLRAAADERWENYATLRRCERGAPIH